MNDITPKTFPNAKALLASIPPHLKDHKNFEKIRKAILEAGSTPHSHEDVLAWASCTLCQQRRSEQIQTIYKLGFKNAAQYKAWHRIHTTIKERVKLR